MEDLLSVLIHSVNQTHVFHLQTKSFSEHKALNKYYDSIGDIVDTLAEAYQGKYGILKYKNVSKIEQYESKEQLIEYFNKILKIIEKARPIKDSFIENIVQEVETLIYSTLYKLKYLNWYHFFILVLLQGSDFHSLFLYSIFIGV